MATDAMSQIIVLAANDPEISEALNDIRGFQVQIITRCSRELLAEIEETGFEFHSSSMSGRKEELKSFLRAHPECMSSDIETLIDKLSIYLEATEHQRRIERQKQVERVKSRRLRRKVIYTDYEPYDAEDVPKKPKKQEKPAEEDHDE